MKLRSAVFLSAGIPHLDLERWRPDVLAIREAVLGLVAVVLAETEWDLVFGGHPAISPLVEHAARSLNAAGRVFIFQSRLFEKMLPPEATAFKNFRFTKMKAEDAAQVEPLRAQLKQPNLAKHEKEQIERKLKQIKDDSLKIMREQMLQSKAFVTGVFIGGMEGVVEEWEIFTKMHPHAQAWPIASTGAAARDLWKKHATDFDPRVRDLLITSKRYRGLLRGLLTDAP